MEEVDPVKRANQLIYDIAVELEIIALDKKMDAAITKELENNQKEYILKEKLSYIQKELGIDKDDNADIKQEYLKKLESLKQNINETNNHQQTYIPSMKYLSFKDNFYFVDNDDNVFECVMKYKGKRKK